MNNPVLRIKSTDGAYDIDLLNPNGICLENWRPAMAVAKGGGNFSDSALSELAALVGYRYALIEDSLPIQIVGADGNDFSRRLQIINRAMIYAMRYFVEDWQPEIVYLERQLKCESNPVYAAIMFGQLPIEGSVYGTAFSQGFDSGLIQADLRRTHWSANIPGTSECVQIASYQDSGVIGINEQGPFAPEVSADDCAVDISGSSINTASTFATLGRTLSTNGMGVRFLSVTVPKNAVIIGAAIKLEAATSLSGNDCDLIIEGEDTNAPAVFSNWADYNARVRTTANEIVNAIDSQTAGDYFYLPATGPVQEIVNRADWASGLNMALFIEDNGSDVNAYRQCHTVDSVTGDEPKLYIWYIDSAQSWTAGVVTPTCDADNRIANFNVPQQIGAIFVWDDSATTFSANRAGSSSFDILPDPVAVGDAVYIAAFAEDGTPAIMSNIIMDLVAVTAGISGNWEYSEGGGVWTSLPDIVDEGWLYAGIQTVSWRLPDHDGGGAWATDTVNGIDAYWVRYNVTGAAGPPDAPVQQNRPIYFANKPWVELAATEIAGDVPALAKHTIRNHSSDSAPSGINPYTQRILSGIRRNGRGSDFVMFINLDDTNYDTNPDGITLVPNGAADAYFSDCWFSPTYYCWGYDRSGTGVWETATEIEFTSDYCRQYRGRYHAFIRAYQENGNAGDVLVRLATISGASVQNIWSSDKIAQITTPDNELEILDMGVIEIPGIEIKNDDPMFGFSILIEAQNDGISTTAILWMVDLILVPTDEWAGDFTAWNGESIWQTNPVNGYELEIDSLEPKIPIRALTRQAGGVEDGSCRGNWDTIANGRAVLGERVAQRVYYFAGTEEVETCIEHVHSVNLDHNARYLAGRGSD